MTRITTDFDISDHGSIIILRPVTEAGREWIDENLPEDATWFGGGPAIERRYFADIYDGFTYDGLTAS